MNTVGIDVSKGKGTIAIPRPYGEIVSSPFEIKYISSNTQSLVEQIRSVEGESYIVMEHTGHYCEPLAREPPLASLFVVAINPKLIKDFGAHSLRKVRSDRADAIKIARYTLDSWMELKQCSFMDELHNQLKTMNRQFGSYMEHKIAIKNSLIDILDQTYSGVNTYLNSPARKDGSQRWVGFATTYWHVDYVCKLSLSAFVGHYQKWYKRRKYSFSKDEAEEIYGVAKELVLILPEDDPTKLTVKQPTEQLDTASKTMEELYALMNDTAARLPGHPVVMSMKGVGSSLGPQLVVEIGDVTCFIHKGTITAFAGVDPGVDESETYEQRSTPTSKCGSSSLRRTLFQAMDCLIRTKPQDSPVYTFIDRKHTQRESYYVYMTVGANKFLCIYYGGVEEHLVSLPEQRTPHLFRPVDSGGPFAISEI